MNIYIKAMKIGSKNLEKGITYPDMLNTLKNKSKTEILATPDSKYNFALWFVDNFSCTSSYSFYKSQNNDFRQNIIFFYRIMEGSFLTTTEIQIYVKNNNDNKSTQTEHRKKHVNDFIREFYNQTFFLNGSTNKQYIDYLELVESRESSQRALGKADESITLAKKSTNFAGWALVISIITAITSIGLSIYQLSRPAPEYPQPPFEVKLKEPIEVKQPILIDTTNYGTIQTN